jgi:hypothetical protein
MAITSWMRKNIYQLRSGHFMVSVEHSLVERVEPTSYQREGVNRWHVYAYIYPKHDLFNKLVGDEFGQTEVHSLPLHGGATYFKRHFFANGECCSIQVGADYNHIDDIRFSYYENMEDAKEVFDDAEELFSYLSKPRDGDLR